MYLVVESTWHLAPHLREKTTRRTARCQWPSGFFFFLFVRLCVCFSFLAEQKLLWSPNFTEHFGEDWSSHWSLAAEELHFFSRNSEQHASKKWNKTKLSSSRWYTILLKVDVFLQEPDEVLLQLKSAVRHLSKPRGPSIPQSASIITIIIINISVLFLTKPEWERQKLSTVTKDIRANVIATCQFLEKNPLSPRGPRGYGRRPLLFHVHLPFWGRTLPVIYSDWFSSRIPREK